MFAWLKPRPVLTLDVLLDKVAQKLQTHTLQELGATDRFMHCLVVLDGAVHAHGFAHYFTVQPEVLAWGACISGLQTVGEPEAASLVNAAVRCHMETPDDHAALDDYSVQYRALALDMRAALGAYLAQHRFKVAA